MALLIYLKDNLQQPLVLKGNMEMLDKRLEDLSQPSNDWGMEFEAWGGNKIRFMSYNSWAYVIEEKDEVVKKRLAEMEKAQKEKQIMMNKSRNPDLITQPQMMFPRGRGRGN